MAIFGVPIFQKAVVRQLCMRLPGSLYHTMRLKPDRQITQLNSLSAWGVAAIQWCADIVHFAAFGRYIREAPPLLAGVSYLFCQPRKCIYC